MHSKRNQRRQMATEGRVTIEKLGTANYGIWKRRIRSLLESKGEWGYITGDEDDKAKSSKSRALSCSLWTIIISRWQTELSQPRACGTSLRKPSRQAQTLNAFC